MNETRIFFPTQPKNNKKQQQPKKNIHLAQLCHVQGAWTKELDRKMSKGPKPLKRSSDASHFRKVIRSAAPIVVPFPKLT
jgi:hypothetical protein